MVVAFEAQEVFIVAASISSLSRGRRGDVHAVGA